MSSDQGVTAPNRTEDEIVELSEVFREQVRELPDRIRHASFEAERRSFAPRRRALEG